jgi:hypothetical protein
MLQGREMLLRLLRSRDTTRPRMPMFGFSLTLVERTRK